MPKREEQYIKNELDDLIKITFPRLVDTLRRSANRIPWGTSNISLNTVSLEDLRRMVLRAYNIGKHDGIEEIQLEDKNED